MIHHKHKTIFIHNPKCGGASIYTLLGGQGDIPLLSWHCPWLVHQNTLDEQTKNDYFKFVFVRNPWDRLLSAYRWYKRGGSRNPRDLAIQNSLPEFLLFVNDLKRYQECEVTAINPPFFTVPHFMPQVYMLGDCEYDFIGRFENFSEDVGHVFDSIGKKGCSLPHQHDGGKVDYREFYTDETREIVAREFAEDIERYDYTF